MNLATRKVGFKPSIKVLSGAAAASRCCLPDSYSLYNRKSLTATLPSLGRKGEIGPLQPSPKLAAIVGKRLSLRFPLSRSTSGGREAATMMQLPSVPPRIPSGEPRTGYKPIGKSPGTHGGGDSHIAGRGREPRGRCSILPVEISRLSTTGTTDGVYVTPDEAWIYGEGSESQLIDRKPAHAYPQLNAARRSFWCLRTFYFSALLEIIGGSDRMPAVGSILSSHVAC